MSCCLCVTTEFLKVVSGVCNEHRGDYVYNEMLSLKWGTWFLTIQIFILLEKKKILFCNRRMQRNAFSLLFLNLFVHQWQFIKTLSDTLFMFIIFMCFSKFSRIISLLLVLYGKNRESIPVLWEKWKHFRASLSVFHFCRCPSCFTNWHFLSHRDEYRTMETLIRIVFNFYV